METAKRTATETTPSNNHTSSPNHLSNSSDKSLLEKQQKDTNYLIKKVRYLEGKISELEGCLFVTQQVNSLLEATIDCQQQYSRFSSLVISEMNEPGDDKNDLDKLAETLARESDINKDIVFKNIDKTHPISKIEEKDLQHRIVKFTSNSFKEKTFKKYKKTPKEIKNQLRMLEYAKKNWMILVKWSLFTRICMET